MPEPAKPKIADPLIGQVVGGYTLEHRIGEGAIGIVYSGRKEDGKVAAVKVVRPELAHDSRYAMTVISEARAVSTIGHPGIVNIIDLGLLADGRPFLAMELVDGSSLEELLSYGPMEPLDALEILEDLFAALDAAHRKNVLHRDIKPANIYLAGDEKGRRVVKLLDFGLARLNFAPGSNASMVVGTPDYMAPEQASSKLTFASDLYSMGVVAFRMLTGQLPFIGQSTMQVIMAHVKHTPQKPSFLKPGLSTKLDTLVLSLLEKSPSQRPPSADAVRQTIAALRKEGGLTVPLPGEHVGEETFRPFVPKTPFIIPSSLQDDPEDSGSHKKRTEPFKQLDDMLHPQSADGATERQMSPFMGKPADVTMPPLAPKPGDVTLKHGSTEKPGDATLRDYKGPLKTGEVPIPDTEATQSSRPTELENKTVKGEASGRGWVWALVAVGIAGAAAAAWYFR